jgi:hypothetical protein
MNGTVTSYSITTLTLSITSYSGSGSYSDWTILDQTGKIYKSINTGVDWVKIQPYGTDIVGNKLCVSYNGSIMLANSYTGLVRSLDYGVTWTNILTDVVQFGCAMTLDGSIIIAGSSSTNKVHLSSDMGSNWIQVSPTVPGQWNHLVMSSYGQKLVLSGFYRIRLGRLTKGSPFPMFFRNV